MPIRPLSAILDDARLPALDGLRAVAVAVVIAYHAGGRIPGDLGVSAFFVLSGFLITWLLLREHDAGGTIDLRAFYLRRTLRIFPAYFVFIGFSLSLDWLAGQAWSGGLVASALTYTVNYYNALNGHPTTSIAHAWSLAVEEQFYLLWPLAFMLLAARGRRALTVGLACLIGAVTVWRSVAYLGLGLPAAWAYNALDMRFDNLAVGCLLAVVAQRGALDRVGRVLAAHPLLPALPLALLLVSRMAGGAAYHYSVGFTVDALLMAVLIVQWLQLAPTRLWSWLDQPIVRYFGLLSYPLYLYHQWGLGIGHKLTILPAEGQVAMGVLAAIALAAGSYYVVERPFLALKRRIGPSRVPVPASASPVKT